MTAALRRPMRVLRNERGVALILAVLALCVLSGLLAAYLAVSTLEPQISRNLADASRARYLAEAGIERGFTVLVTTADASGGWSGLLAGATRARPWVAIPGLANAAIGGATHGGVFSVTIRNDNGAADTPLTGLSAATTPAMDTSPTSDGNKTVIMRSAGTFNGVTKTIEVVVQRAALPPLAGAVNILGPSVHTVVDATALEIDGRDYGCTAGCDTASNWTLTANPLKYGMAVRPGAQGPTGSALETPAKRDAVKGKSGTDPAGSYTTGHDAVAGDGSLTPAMIDAFVSRVASNPATTVLHSTPACPIVVTGSASSSTNAPTLSNGCGLTTGVNLGSREDPKLVFVRGKQAPTPGFTGLTLHQGIKGAGILVVQDGDLHADGDLEWDGLVMVAGPSTSLAFIGQRRTIIRGAVVASDSNLGSTGGAVDFPSAAAFSIRSSQQNLDTVQAMRSLHSITNWREI